MSFVESYEVIAEIDGEKMIAVELTDDATVEQAKEESAQAGVECEYNVIYTLMSKTNDDYSANTTGVFNSKYNQYYNVSEGFTEAWDYARAGEADEDSIVEVAVIDSGAYLSHEDLNEAIDTDKAYNAFSMSKLSHSTFAYDGRSNEYYDGDYYGHGTEVCGVIGAETNNDMGVTGTSYGAKIIPVACFNGSGTATSYDIVNALNYIDKLIEDGDENLKIVNCSYGSYTSDRSALAVMQHMYDEHDVLFVCAGGNGKTVTKTDEDTGKTTTSTVPNTDKLYPADYDFTLSVTANTKNHTQTTWADYNDSKDISAAGEGIVTTGYPITSHVTDNYVVDSGTSFSAPIVSGAAALLYSLDPDLTSEQVVDLLKSTATEVEGQPEESSSAGEVNASAAVQKLIEEYLGGTDNVTHYADEHGELPHTPGDVTYTWSDDMLTCSAAAVCQDYYDYNISGKLYHSLAACTLEYTGTATVTYSITKEPTDDEPGTGVYTAVFENSLFETQTKEVTIPSKEAHTYSDPTYDWSEGNSACTATVRCNSCDKTITETAKVTSAITQNPTCEAKGETTFTAEFTDQHFTTQTTTGEIEATGHNYRIQYFWESDDSQCTAMRTCTNNTKEAISETVESTKEIISEPTCNAAGTTKYTATFKNENFQTQEKTTSQSALGHNYKITYTWAEDNSTCTARRVCENDAEDDVNETVNSVIQIIANPTCTEAGSSKYTATFKKDFFDPQEKEFETAPTNHNFTTNYTWSEDKTSCTATAECTYGDAGTITETSYDITVDENTHTYTAKFTVSPFVDNSIVVTPATDEKDNAGNESDQGQQTPSTPNTDNNNGSSSPSGSNGGSAGNSPSGSNGNVSSGSAGSSSGGSTSSGGSSNGNSTTPDSTADSSSTTQIPQVTSNIINTGFEADTTHTYENFVTVKNTDGSSTYTFTDTTSDAKITYTVAENGATVTTYKTDSDTTNVINIDSAQDTNGVLTLPSVCNISSNAAEYTFSTGNSAKTVVFRLGKNINSTNVVVTKSALASTLSLLATTNPTPKITNKYENVTVTNDGIQLNVDEGYVYTILANNVSFTDVANTDWFNEAVNYVSSHEIMNGSAGKGSSTFSPNSKLTRGMMATLLYNKSVITEEISNNYFTDVTADDWYSVATNWAFENQIITGYSNGTFGADDNITREQVATILWRAAGSPAVNGNLDFPDAENVSEYAHQAVVWCTQSGIITGNNGQILPQADASRAEIAAMIQRFDALFA